MPAAVSAEPRVDAGRSGLRARALDRPRRPVRNLDDVALPESRLPKRFPRRSFAASRFRCSDPILDFSIWDRAGFSENPSPEEVAQTDLRDARAEKGRMIIEDTVEPFVNIATETMKTMGHEWLRNGKLIL